MVRFFLVSFPRQISQQKCCVFPLFISHKLLDLNSLTIKWCLLNDAPHFTPIEKNQQFFCIALSSVLIFSFHLCLSLSGNFFLSDFLTEISFGSFFCPMSWTSCKSSISRDLIKDTKHYINHCWFTLQRRHHWWQEITFCDAFHCSPFISCSHPVYRGRPPDVECAYQQMYVIAWHGIYDSLLFCCKLTS